ncbi:MAG: ABATE domain-containing protein [Vicinamibacterales bacterium]
MAQSAVRHGGIQTPRGYRFEITGGHLALDLANTVDVRPTPEPRELLRDWADLVGWSVQAHAIDAPSGRRLAGEGARRPEEAGAVLRRVRFLREALFTIFSSIAAGRPVPPDSLAVLNDAAALALARRRVVSRRGGFEWTWQHPEGSLDTMIPPVVHAAADLLCTPDLLARVRACAARDRCAWLFLDLSRNGSRRWCDMSVCGNRAKARRFYQRIARTSRHRAARA